MADKQLISASKIGKMAWCPHGSSLQENGAKPSVRSRSLMDAGDEAHTQLTQTVIANQGQDKRCFVASYALGSDHPTTQFLRNWRDDRLMPTMAGRALVRTYYSLSPIMIRCTSLIPGARVAARWLVVVFAKLVGQRGGV